MKNQPISERTYAFAKSVTSSLRSIRGSGGGSRNFTKIEDQLFRSATSVGANIAESYNASSKRDFANFFNHSLKSANESRYWLRLVRDCFSVDESKANALIQEALEISKILAASIKTMRESLKSCE